MGVSKNKGTPKWMVYNGKPYQNGWFGGTPIFGNTHMFLHHSALPTWHHLAWKKSSLAALVRVPLAFFATHGINERRPGVVGLLKDPKTENFHPYHPPDEVREIELWKSSAFPKKMDWPHWIDQYSWSCHCWSKMIHSHRIPRPSTKVMTRKRDTGGEFPGFRKAKVQIPSIQVILRKLSFKNQRKLFETHSFGMFFPHPTVESQE